MTVEPIPMSTAATPNRLITTGRMAFQSTATVREIPTLAPSAVDDGPDIVKSRLKILHVASSYPLHDGDATAPFMAEMLEAQASQGHSVTALVPRVDGLVEGDRNGVRVVGAPYAPSALQVWGHGRSLGREGGLRFIAAAITPVALGSMALKLRSLLTNERPDVVHLHWVLPQGLLVDLIPQETKVVVTAHGADLKFVKGRLRPLARRALRRADAIVAASPRVLSCLEDIDPSVRQKSHAIPHGADSSLFRPGDRTEARSTLGLELNAPLVLGVGRLVQKKGFDALIAGFAALNEPTAHLAIVGDGPDRDRLTGLVPGELVGRVRFVGSQTRAQVADWYAAADVVVIASKPIQGDVDSGPVVLVEAMASGRPVVASSVGMAPEFVSTGVNGVLLESCEPLTIAEAIAESLSNSDTWGASARRTFESLGDWQRVALDLTQVYS